MKTFILLSATLLGLAGCSDTIVMQSADGVQDTCEYSLMYRSLHQCVQTAQEAGMTMTNSPSWWTFYR